MKYNISKSPFFLRNHQRTSTFQMKMDWHFNWPSEDTSDKEKWQWRRTNKLKFSNVENTTNAAWGNGTWLFRSMSNI